MSNDDAARWNARYAAGAYAGRTRPSQLLLQWLPVVAPGRALDVACGAGRNALYLAQQGFAVDAVDVSATALQRAAESAASLGVTVNWIEHDLDTPLPASEHYQLIVLVRYADAGLTRALCERLAPGGVLLVEAHLAGPLCSAAVGGPGGARFRLAPGELATACSSLTPLFLQEQQVVDPDGSLMALTRFVGRRESAA